MSDDLPTEIILSGGNFATISFLGSIQALIDKKQLNMSKIKRWVGTSGGSVIAFLLIIGFEPSHVFNIIKQLPIHKISPMTSEKWLSFFDSYGLHNTKTFRNIFETFLTHKGFDKDITFESLYEKTGVELVFTTFCLNTDSVVLLDHKTNSTLKILDGLCMTIAVPFLFFPVSYQNRLYIDAVLVTNLPVEYSNTESSICFCLEKKKQYNENIDVITFLRILFKSPIDRMQQVSLQNYKGTIINVACDYEFDTSFNLNASILESFYSCGYNTEINE